MYFWDIRYLRVFFDGMVMDFDDFGILGFVRIIFWRGLLRFVPTKHVKSVERRLIGWLLFLDFNSFFTDFCRL